MDEKFTIAGLADALAKRHGMDAEDASAFVRSFFSLIEEALVSDRYVKIRGLGTFKLINVDSRESISVNTGERIEIQGHLRITFTPDQAMRNTVNKPFSHFETVLLHEGVKFDDITEEEGEETESPSDETEKDAACNETAYESDEPSGPAVVEPSAPDQTEVAGDPDSKDVSGENDEGANRSEESLEEPNNEIQDEVDADEEGSDADGGTCKLVRMATMVFLALLLGVFIGGSIIWFAFVKEKEAGNNDVKEKVVVPADPASDTAGITRPDTVVARPFVAEEKDSLPYVAERKKAEALPDTIDYEMAGTLSSHVVQGGESLVKIALKYYGNKKLWPYIERYNKDLLKNADNLPVGTTIRIPKLVPKEVKTGK